VRSAHCPEERQNVCPAACVNTCIQGLTIVNGFDSSSAGYGSSSACQNGWVSGKARTRNDLSAQYGD
jgi:hypothetical protein